MAFPKVVVLDLDGTVWDPEMYQLWGRGGSPFTAVAWDALKDRAKTTVSLFDGVADCIRDSLANGAVLSIASTTDEPEWAKECLTKFKTDDAPHAKPLGHVFQYEQIYKASSKRVHLEAIRKKVGCAFSDMLFIDNEPYNLKAVAPLGVECYYCPDGLTEEAWQKALEKFQSK